MSYVRGLVNRRNFFLINEEKFSTSSLSDFPTVKC